MVRSEQKRCQRRRRGRVLVSLSNLHLWRTGRPLLAEDSPSSPQNGGVRVASAVAMWMSRVPGVRLSSAYDDFYRPLVLGERERRLPRAGR
jgi:hypothetical protein